MVEAWSLTSDLNHKLFNRKYSMRKIFFTSVPATLATLFLVSACANDDAESKTVADVKPATEAVKTETTTATSAATGSIMDQPVDFSSPENVKRTLQSIREQAGDEQAGSLKSAMDYLIVYDLNINRDKIKLYKKLNGKTPNEIMGMTRR